MQKSISILFFFQSFSSLNKIHCVNNKHLNLSNHEKAYNFLCYKLPIQDWVGFRWSIGSERSMLWTLCRIGELLLECEKFTHLIVCYNILNPRPRTVIPGGHEILLRENISLSYLRSLVNFHQSFYRMIY
jgi:hypothetical protein